MTKVHTNHLVHSQQVQSGLKYPCFFEVKELVPQSCIITHTRADPKDVV